MSGYVYGKARAIPAPVDTSRAGIRDWAAYEKENREAREAYQVLLEHHTRSEAWREKHL